MTSYGPRFTDDGRQTMRVAQAAIYELHRPFYVRHVGNGRVTCYPAKRAGGPGMRLVQLVAEYTDAGCLTTAVVQVGSLEEELAELARLERRILEASRRPAATAR